jgi:peptidoglycan/LPS O-acetylase OafA/YrhL
MAAFEVLMIINGAVFMRLPEDVTWRETVLPFYGIAMMSCGLVAGIVALVALTRRHERSWLVWLSVLVGLSVIVFILGEFLVPH